MGIRFLVLVTVASLVGLGFGRAEGLGPVSEIRVGLHAHETSSRDTLAESADVSISGEVLFNRPSWRFENRFVDFFLRPRPHVGAIVTTGSGTSFAYGGVTWDLTIFGPVFVEFAFGAAVHGDGIDKTLPTDRSLGSHLLFHEQASIGVEITEQLRVMATVDHISNADLAEHNTGLTTAGVRAGYRF